jgi:hypothetical protein
VTRLRATLPGFDSWQRQGFFSSPPRPDLPWAPPQPPNKRVTGAISLGTKRPGRDADHLHPSSVEIKNAWNHTSTLPISLHGVVLNSEQDMFSGRGIWSRTGGILNIYFYYFKIIFRFMVQSKKLSIFITCCQIASSSEQLFHTFFLTLIEGREKNSFFAM